LNRDYFTQIGDNPAMIKRAWSTFCRRQARVIESRNIWQAECYYFGKGVQVDTAKAVEFLQEATALGEPRAMDLLASHYRRLRQFDRARKYYEDAAAAGYALSLSNLGVLYMNGEGVQRSPEVAANLFRQGAEKGDPSGMFFYASCLQDGLGVPKDSKTAADWFRRSARAGNPRAIEWCRQNGVLYK